MKKTIFTALAAITISICLVSCGNEEAAEGNVIVTPDDGGYSIELPEAWEISRTDGLVAAYVPGDATKANVTAYKFETGLNEYITSADYWEKYKTQFEDTFTGMTVEKIEETKISGIDAQYVYYTVNIGLDTFNCQTVLGVNGTDVYVVTLTQGVQTGENVTTVDYTDTFKEIVNSFKAK